ncbi:MAG: protein kinase, partial [Acidobacteriota bacterium]
MALQPGAQLGPYEIVGPLGAGGMGEVYRARDTRLDREVAVKVLPQHLSASTEARQRFEREARSASSLNHPNICTVHDIGSHEGTDYLVMELLEGETLADRIERGPMPLDELLKVAIPLADALDRAHRSGLVHRDLKPQNVMLAPGGAKLMDFGLAKGMEASSPTDLTATPTMTSPLTAAGTILGTFQYMAPEQLDGKEADARSDLFAFGAMLYEMATGRRAFRGETQASLIAAILKEEPTPLPEARPSMPQALDHVVSRCLAKDPEARWQTARDMGAELQWIAAAGGAVAPAAAEPEAVDRRGLPAWSWLAAALAAVGIFAGGWLLHRAPVPPRQVVRSSVNLSPGTVLDTNNRSLALSPDGTLLAYAGRNAEGTTGIWVRRLDSLDARHLAGTEGATYPFWSPDGQQLGFFADGRLRRIPAGGGTAQTVTEAPDGRGATWGANGTIVFAPAPFGPLMKVAAAGGESTPVTTEDRPDWTHRNPHFLPDGQRLLFFMGPPIVGEGGSIQSLDLRTGETRKVADAESEGMFVEPGYLAFVREGNLVVQPIDRSTLELSGEPVPIVEGVQFNTFRWAGTFTFSRTGLLVYQQGAVQAESQLTWFDLEGRKLETVGDPAIFWVNLKISPDGRRAVTSIRRPDGRSDVWIYDLQRGMATRFTFGDVPALGPLWSPDGGLVAFSDGGSHIWIKSSDGT